MSYFKYVSIVFFSIWLSFWLAFSFIELEILNPVGALSDLNDASKEERKNFLIVIAYWLLHASSIGSALYVFDVFGLREKDDVE